MGSSSRSAASCVVAGLLAAAPALRAAEQLTYGAYLGTGFSDNVTRVSTNEEDDTIAAIGGQLGVDHDSKRLNLKIASRLEYRTYLNDTYDDEVVGNLIGSATFDIIEERFTWTVDDTFGQTTQNQFAPDTPDNRESVNYLSTGPDFKFALGSRNDLILRGRYTNLNYEDSDLGNERLGGEITFQRNLSQATKVSLNAKSEEVSYDEAAAFTDYDYAEAYLGYEVNAARTTLSIQGGVAQLESGGQSDDSWLGRLELTRRVSANLTVGAELGHDIGDAGNWFAKLQAGQPGSLEPVPVQQAATPFENNYGLIFAHFSRNRTELEVHAGFFDEQYELQPEFDRKRFTLDVSVYRDLNAALRAHLRTNYAREDYEALDLDFADLNAALGLRWNFGRATFLSVEYQFLDRSGDAAAQEYQSNELWLRLAYMVGGDVGSGAYGGL